MESLNDSYSDQQHTSSWDSQKQGLEMSSNSVDTEALQPHLGGNIEQRRHYAENILRDEQVKPNGTVTITPHFRQLPNEILLADDRYARGRQRNIYTWTLVSKQFYAIANPLLWIEPVLNIVDPSINVRRRMQQLLDGLAVTQQPLGDYVRTLVLSNSFCSDTDLLRLMPYIRHQHTRLSTHCPHLTSLTLSNIFLSDATFRALGQHCHQLNDLTLKAARSMGYMFVLFPIVLWKKSTSQMVIRGCFLQHGNDVASFQGLTHLTLNGAASLDLSDISQQQPQLTTRRQQQAAEDHRFLASLEGD
ncbi:hypothetical protein BCR42DRAFT_455998 [Absidia repens]|uniref:Uncharacterized protein n=1 Tax=Absidia repens TaxID=90262 RepID=A0A1X2I199_9FUNG|nr:hypothetical protein BCR42DRAFT_455998 [Absidia repens]